MEPIRENGLLNGALPWWAKTVWMVGPVTVIALGLVWLISVGMRDDLRTIRENLLLHHQDSEQLHRNIERYMELQNNLTRQLCVNAAQSPKDRDACFRP